MGIEQPIEIPPIVWVRFKWVPAKDTQRNILMPYASTAPSKNHVWESFTRTTTLLDIGAKFQKYYDLQFGPESVKGANRVEAWEELKGALKPYLPPGTATL